MSPIIALVGVVVVVDLDLERQVSRAVKAVATYLGNTPAVCRAYVDPRVIDRYHVGVTIAQMIEDLPPDGSDLANAGVRRRIEAAVLELLTDMDPLQRKAA